ncbi:hypothetical protein, partial [Citrobacter freundii]|uniref:hypothetical protein n=1 Tax=Citrobacter freundii TaxID=546 RepID=UPI003C12C4E2|nr:hypothetical protein [Citrobacter freundii]
MNNIINSKRNQELNFKIDMLPHRIRKWVLYLHFMTGVAIEIVVLSLLAFLGLACQDLFWIGPYISIHFLSLNPLLVRRRRYSRG